MQKNMGAAAEPSSTPNWATVLFVGRDPRRTLTRIVFLIAGSLILFKLLLLPIRVEGISMLPTYREKRVNFVNRLAYVLHPPRRGDVVAIRLAGRHVMFMKRIIGLPGETIEFRRGKVFINGRLLEEPYLAWPCNWDRSPERIGPGEYYVVGDNRTMDWNDHVKGLADRDRIVGKVLL